jgi:hypothetical protein
METFSHASVLLPGRLNYATLCCWLTQGSRDACIIKDLREAIIVQNGMIVDIIRGQNAGCGKVKNVADWGLSSHPRQSTHCQR